MYGTQCVFINHFLVKIKLCKSQFLQGQWPTRPTLCGWHMWRNIYVHNVHINPILLSPYLHHVHMNPILLPLICILFTWIRFYCPLFAPCSHKSNFIVPLYAPCSHESDFIIPYVHYIHMNPPILLPLSANAKHWIHHERLRRDHVSFHLIL